MSDSGQKSLTDCADDNQQSNYDLDGDCFSINKYYFLDIGHFLMWVDISYTVNDVHQLTSDKITDIAWLSTFQPLLSRR